MGLKIQIAKEPAKYFQRLDRPTKKRILKKLEEIAADPLKLRIAKPIQSDSRLSTRVGDYRIFILIEENTLIVSEIGPRGQVYKSL
jgi:mRNA interferase RelE/StbE